MHICWALDAVPWLLAIMELLNRAGLSLEAGRTTYRFHMFRCFFPLLFLLARRCYDRWRNFSMLSSNTSDAGVSPRTVYGSDNEHGFPGMEVFHADQTPELVPAERLSSLSQPQRSPSNELKPWLNFSRTKKNASKNEQGSNDHDTKRSPVWKLGLLIIILGVGIIITLAIALPLSLRHRGRGSR